MQMEMQKQQTPKSPNKVNFSEQNRKDFRLSDSNSLMDMKQKTTKQIEDETNNQILISSQESWDIETVKEKLAKFVKFMKFHNVDQTQIWKKKRELTISEFANLVNQNYGFYLTNDQLAALLKLCNKKQSLKPKDFEPLDLWIEEINPYKINRYSNNLSSQTLQIKKPRKQKKQNYNELNNSYNFTTKNIEIPQQQIRKTSETFKSSFNLTKSFGNEGFQEAQKYSKAKVQMKVEELKKDIKESVLQKKWDFIVMAGEMNQWNDRLQKQTQKKGSQIHAQNLLPYRFKVLNRDPVEIIQQNIDVRTEEPIPHVVFIKKYQTLKKKMVKQENNKNNLKGTVLMVLEDQDKFSKNNLINRINQRDQELNFVLLQIMRMKSMFQWQNNILKEAKINS